MGYAAIYILGLGSYFWVLIIMFLSSDWTNTCIQGWYWLDLINFCFIICITSVFGMILLFGAIASVFYLPLVIQTINGAYYKTSETNKLIKTLVHKGFNPTEHK